VIQTNASQAAADLGLIPAGATSSAAASVVGGVSTITGADVNPSEVQGVFNSLLRLQHALETNDQGEIQRSVAQLDDSSLQVVQARSELGAREQGLDALQSRLSDEVVNLKDSLSKETDVDWASALSEYTNRQAAFQAALQTTAAISKLSLLNYL
jgi:flagellar hook-associated protein 3 FlgL